MPETITYRQREDIPSRYKVSRWTTILVLCWRGHGAGGKNEGGQERIGVGIVTYKEGNGGTYWIWTDSAGY